MLPRWPIFLSLSALPLFFGLGESVNGTVWLKKYMEFPTCGTTCALEIVPKSNCKTLTNFTCLCEDLPIREVMTECIFKACTGMETLTLAKLEAEGCETPYRSRRAVLLGLIPIQVIVFASFFLRFLSRKVTVGKYDRDDYIMFCVLMLYIMFVAIGNLAYFRGFGVDIWTVEAHHVDSALKLFYFSNTAYLIIMELTKISILMFYLRVFPDDKFRLATFVTIGWVISCTLLFMGLQIFQCLPIQFNWFGWRGDFGDHQCIDINRFAYAAGSTMIAQDVVVLFLPLPWLIGLNTSMRNKIGVIIMFSMGIFILITSCIRLKYLVAYARTLNPTWDYTDQLVWSSLEIAVSILVVNIPAIRVLFVKKIAPVVRSVFTGQPVRVGGSMYYGRNTENKSLASASRVESRPRRGRRSRSSSAGSKFSRNNSLGLCEDPPLELGDKIKGDVHTMICAGTPMGSTDELRRASSTSSRHVRGQSEGSDIGVGCGILVETTTTRMVATNATGDTTSTIGPMDGNPVSPSSPLGGRSSSASAAPGRNFSMPNAGRVRTGTGFGSLGV